ncbi:Heme-binding protein A precursor [Symmachiella macrocystis]|uniref:Heme-binding protein A n=1 Tax=Symmachiella macrocystis TaxID=2527985 RepID=A0A5C6BKE0_9PLAN|nr:ABC transporter substrate-binding protein [Symmachiella macrocystis]TWU11991.1 Heme-binding protein A precursor [Symmachiella macrocystis]
MNIAQQHTQRAAWFTRTLHIAAVLALLACSSCSRIDEEGKVLRLPLRADDPKSLDPVQGSTVYDNKATCQVYETLVQYKYLIRPPELEPLLLSEMPTISEDRLTYHFKLKPGVLFHDDPCFPEGKGRELVTDDVFYSWKRMADNGNNPKSWWLLKDTIKGFDEYREKQNAAVEAKQASFDYDAPVAGMQKINDHEFRVILKQPVQRFMWVLAMFQTAIVPREAVEEYGDRFGRHPVGTGAFTLAEEDWRPGQRMVFYKNPSYHPCYYPTEHMPSDVAAGWTKDAGKRLPLVDRLEFQFFVQDQPMWLSFRTGKIDYTQVPDEYFDEAFLKRTKTLRPKLVREGITTQNVELLDFIFRGFNMEDELLGGYGEKQKKLRQAISLAIDLDEFNEAFYSGINSVYDGPIPPGLEGFPPNGKADISYRGPNLERARQLLAEAGYPEGKGLPRIEFYTSSGRNNVEQTELLKRQLSKINVEINAQIVEFSTLIEKVHNKKAPFFGFAWGSDYPDAENNLALFYSPNAAPGSNSFNYSRPEYDRLYEQIRSMPPSPERTELYIKMRDMVIEDTPYTGSMGRTRFYLINPWLKNFKVTEDFYNWPKYLDVSQRGVYPSEN